MQEMKNTSAGFWLRLLALYIDILIVYGVLKLVFYALLISPFTIYFPLEATLIAVLAVYSAIMTSLNGYTIGKWFLGIKVVDKNGEKLPVWKAILRELLLKPLSAAILFIGFLIAVFNKKKRGLHDITIGSLAVKSDTHPEICKYAKPGAAILFIISAGMYIYSFADPIVKSINVSLNEQIQFPFMTRNADLAIELNGEKPIDDSLYVNWVQTNCGDPSEYAVEKAAKYQVTLFGEAHMRKSIINFYNTLIPDLYYKSDVRCVAMECIAYSMNEKLEKLVNGETYDHDLALSIAREMNWKTWGFEEYWQTMEAVWELNMSLPADAPKMRIIGIDSEWDGPKVAYVNVGEDKVENYPVVENLKFFSVIDDFVRIVLRDHIMAYCIEKEIIEKNIKGVVLIGSSHVFRHFSFPSVEDGKVVKTSPPRMGALLQEKYPDKVYTILISQLHMGSSFVKNMEDVMTASGKEYTAFDIKDSPFAMWRDKESFIFSWYPSIVFDDLFDGFIYIGTNEKIQKSSWMDNYVSKEMFMKYKPYYDARVKQKFYNETEVNAYFKTEYP